MYAACDRYLNCLLVLDALGDSFLGIICRFCFQSVQHENSYRDPKAKFCYGESPPDLQPVGT